jgi:hypothetical protein
VDQRWKQDGKKPWWWINRNRKCWKLCAPV